MPERLYRSRRDRIIGGVAGGLAHALNVDPSIVRVVWVILALVTNGLALIVYLVMLIVVPEAPDEPWGGWPEATGSTAEPQAARGSVVGQASESATEPATAAGAPPTTAGEPRVRPSRSSSERLPLALGLILILLGVYFLFRQFIDLDLVWPIVVIGLGVLLIVGAIRPGRGAR